jgi:hypothetical protein
MFVRNISSYQRKENKQVAQRPSKFTSVHHGGSGLVVSVLDKSEIVESPVERRE